MPWVQKKAPMQVENVEIEGMRLHMERDGKGEVNVWACLGMDAKAGEAAYADAQKSTDAQEQDLEEDGNEDGTDEKNRRRSSGGTRWKGKRSSTPAASSACSR